MSSVVNVKVKYIRPLGYDNLREWMADPNNVYVGRPGVVFIDGARYPPTKDYIGSKFANPYKIGSGRTREDVIEQYETWLLEEMDAGRITNSDLAELQGKNLGCWCAPDPCHADVIMEYL